MLFIVHNHGDGPLIRCCISLYFAWVYILSNWLSLLLVF